MADTPSRLIPESKQVARKLEETRFQIQSLETLIGAAPVGSSGPDVRIDSCTGAAIQHMLEAILASLQNLNRLLPDPLPPLRVSRRNLRDRFLAVQGHSDALRLVDQVARPSEGWLWWLERKRAAAPYFPLITEDLAVWRDPTNPSLGVEIEQVLPYLRRSLARVDTLTRDVLDLCPSDAHHYQECLRGQRQRIMWTPVVHLGTYERANPWFS